MRRRLSARRLGPVGAFLILSNKLNGLNVRYLHVPVFRFLWFYSLCISIVEMPQRLAERDTKRTPPPPPPAGGIEKERRLAGRTSGITKSS